MGNDVLNGGDGDDTYIFGLGYGHDTISDGYGRNKIKFINGIRPSDLQTYASGSSDIVIKVKGTEDQLTLKYSRSDSSNRNFIFEFDDGTVLDQDSAAHPLRVIQGTEGDDSISAYLKDMTIQGESGNDWLYGSSGADKLYGGAGNDTLSGYDGNDLLDGGNGNDKLEGGSGNDTYIFDLGHGQDTISDSEGLSTIRFGAGIALADLQVSHPANSSWSTVLTNTKTGDSITFSNFRYSASYRNLKLVFSDGTELGVSDEGSPFRTLYGTSESEYLSSPISNMTIYAGTGNDTLNGSSGSDKLYGDKGNDELNGGDGNDLLDGGSGNDKLSGGAGDDTYIFDLGHGQDTISDYEGLSTIRFGEGIALADLQVSHPVNSSWSTVLTNTKTGDSITFSNFRYSASYRNLKLVFSDGTELGVSDEGSPFRTLYGTSESEYLSSPINNLTIYAGAGNDTLNGSSGSDKLYGDEGNDLLEGGSGNDLLEGGSGNDKLYGGAGDDTYIFDLGHGQDTISDSEGLSTIRFGEGISPENLKLAKSDNWNLSLTQGDDQLILNNYFYSSSYRNVHLEFSDKRTAIVNDQLMTLDVKAAPVSESVVTPAVQAQTLETLVNDVASSNPVTDTSRLPQASTTEIRAVTQSQLLVQEVSALPSENTVSAVNSAVNTNTNLFTEQLTVQ